MHFNLSHVAVTDVLEKALEDVLAQAIDYIQKNHSGNSCNSGEGNRLEKDLKKIARDFVRSSSDKFTGALQGLVSKSASQRLEHLDKQEKEVREFRDELERERERWARMDEKTRRLKVAGPDIEMMLPFDPKRGENYAAQVIRSRGYSIAALLGMQSIDASHVEKFSETETSQLQKNSSATR